MFKKSVNKSKRTNQKAQVTLFIIIALLILAIILLVFFYFKPLTGLIKADIDKPVYKDLRLCIQEKSVEGIFQLGKQGGYYNISSPFGYYYEITLPFFFKDGKSLLPQITFFEREFSQYMETKVKECLANLNKFEQYGYTIDIEFNKTKVIANFNEKTNLKVDYSVRVSKNSAQILLKPTDLTLDFNFLEKYSLMKEIIEEQEKNPNSLPFLFIIDLAKQNRFDFELIDLNDSNYILILLFNTTLKEEPYRMAFLIGYNFTEFSSEKEISIAPIPEFNITQEEIFEYKINATGKDLSYYAYTNLFNISRTGLIKFNTSILPNGRTEVLIKVTDFKNESAYAFMIFNVNISK
ncbi:MAG: hypothetical protein QXK80_01445 [Candidatus Pacearchaeota archaeon]